MCEVDRRLPRASVATHPANSSGESSRSSFWSVSNSSTSSSAFSFASSQIWPCRMTSAPYPSVAAIFEGVAFSAMHTTA